MRAALLESFIPALIEKGFTGEFPHYQRITEERVSLLSITFDKLGASFSFTVSYLLRRGEETNILPQYRSLPLESINTSKTINKKVFPDNASISFCDIVHITIHGHEESYSITEDQKRVFLKSLPKDSYYIEKIADSCIYKKCANAALLMLPMAEKWWAAQPSEPPPPFSFKNFFHKFRKRKNATTS